MLFVFSSFRKQSYSSSECITPVQSLSRSHMEIYYFSVCTFLHFFNGWGCHLMVTAGEWVSGVLGSISRSTTDFEQVI